MLFEILGIAGIIAVPVLDKMLFGGGTGGSNAIEKFGDRMASEAMKSGNQDCIDSATKYYEAKSRRADRNNDRGIIDLSDSDDDY